MSNNSSLNLRLRDFKDRVGLGTRSNRYEVIMNVPGSINVGSVNGYIQAEVSAASLPASVINPIPVPFRGRTLKLPGDRLYAPWQFMVYDSPKALVGGDSVWGALHKWSDKINNHESNITNYGPDDSSYVADWTIRHYDLNGNTLLKEITLHNCWPSIVGEVALVAGAMDQLVQFNCVVEYEYFTGYSGVNSNPASGNSTASIT